MTEDHKRHKTETYMVYLFLVHVHNIPKDAKIQHVWGMFSNFLIFKNIIKNHDFRFMKI